MFEMVADGSTNPLLEALTPLVLFPLQSIFSQVRSASKSRSYHYHYPRVPNMDKISKIVQNTLKAGYLPIETEYQLQLMNGQQIWLGRLQSLYGIAVGGDGW